MGLISPKDMYVTLTLPFNASSTNAKELLLLARKFRLALYKVWNKAKLLNSYGKISMTYELRPTAYEILKNRRYADAIIDIIRSTILSAKALKINLEDIEWNNWLIIQSEGEKNKGNANITLRKDLSFAISVGNRRKVIIKPTTSKKYRSVLEKLYELRQPYYARVIIKGWGIRKGELWIHGEIHISIRADIYYSIVGIKQNNGRNFGGVDINVDRLNLAIINKEGELLDVKGFRFKYARMRPTNRKMVWSEIGERIHEMLKYAYYHGVKVLYLENPSILGRLATLWRIKGERYNRTYNYLKNSFRTSIIERIMLKAPLYEIIVEYVNPKGTTNSTKHKIIMKKYGLDRHCASAYLIALRGIKKY